MFVKIVVLFQLVHFSVLLKSTRKPKTSEQTILRSSYFLYLLIQSPLQSHLALNCFHLTFFKAWAEGVTGPRRLHNRFAELMADGYGPRHIAMNLHMPASKHKKAAREYPWRQLFVCSLVFLLVIVMSHLLTQPLMLQEVEGAAAGGAVLGAALGLHNVSLLTSNCVKFKFPNAFLTCSSILAPKKKREEA